MTIDPESSPDFESDKVILKLSIQMSAEKQAIDSVVQSIMEVVTEMGCHLDKENAIELALTEALANAVVHGAGSDPSKIIECDVACDQNRTLLIVVRDPGEGFDPSKIPSPVSGENLFSSHGRGIYLINQLMDEVKYLKNGTEIRMLKK